MGRHVHSFLECTSDILIELQAGFIAALMRIVVKFVVEIQVVVI
jgi:hypothetical protein